MKINALLEEVTRNDILLCQEKVIDVLPDNFDIGLDERNVDGGIGVWTSNKLVVTVTRNGKELFTIRPLNPPDRYRVDGKEIKSFNVTVSALQAELANVMIVFDLRRKLMNLIPNVKCTLGRNAVYRFIISIYSDTDQGFFGLDYLIITYGGGKYELSHKNNLQSKTILATTNDETKLIQKVETAVKMHFTE